MYANQCELQTSTDSLIIGEHIANCDYFVYKCAHLKANNDVFNGFFMLRKNHFIKIKFHIFINVYKCINNNILRITHN